jgi:hypothetical protein
MKLPVVSSVANTNFCVVTIEGPGGRLHIDGNSKITAGNGSYANPSPNAFSLPSRAVEAIAGNPGLHCPDATPTCMASCYVGGLAGHVPELYQLYRENFETVQANLGTPQESYWTALLANWITSNAPGGFRWHVSGDLYSCEYATFVAAVVQQSPNVRHWIYTRSFWLTAVFVGLPNIAVNYSVDRDNLDAAMKYYDAHQAADSPVRLCYLASGDGKVPELPKGAVVFPDYHLRGSTSDWFAALPSGQKQMVCPVDLHGKSERRRCGPCDRCIRPVAGDS